VIRLNEMAVCNVVGEETAASSNRAQFIPFLVTLVDVSKRSDVDAWIDLIVEKYGQPNGAANCVGIIGKHRGIGSIAELEDDERDKIMAVNLTRLMYCLRAELRRASDGASIVNVASI
jgi:NAD(P)-dependent dehydrogenase (short-subunit alcohol dehydrogenase family)